MKPVWLTATALAAVCVVGMACRSAPLARTADAASSVGGRQTGKIPHFADREAFYGDLHLHTSYSFDAYMTYGARVVPDEAYRFARGETLSLNGVNVKRRWPLDFAAVTDHAEYLGTLRELEDPRSAFAGTALGRRIAAREQAAMFTVWSAWARHTALPGFDTEPVLRSAWAREVQAANAHYRPGLFTTFIGYEWTSHVGLEKQWDEEGNLGPGVQGVSNLHRNVIFSGDRASLPFTAIDSVRPEDLWKYLESNRRRGIEALAIPHNGNASNGLMYDWVDSEGKPIDAVYARRRLLNEPLSEIGQLKGQSETHPALSPNDEFADFELDDFTARPGEKRMQAGSYIRDAYGRGLAIAQKSGTNPYKFGINGGTDIHNGLSTSDEDAILPQGHAGIDPSQPAFKVQFRAFLAKGPDSGALRVGSGNLTGVWAEQNTRESIYAAFRRKETFATSGTRLRIRFFGGWNYARSLLQERRWVRTAYRLGVPMGSDLPAAGRRDRAPVFAISAVKDPDGANLDRVQVIKVWLEGGSAREKVFDAILAGNRRADPATGKAPALGSTVDLATARFTNSVGATELTALWRDPEFKAAQPALYYLRVLEIPTPRWSTIQARAAGLAPPKGAAAVIQERGWSSPIWYSPRAG